MTVTVGTWMLPAFVSAAAWAWAIFRPLPPSRGDYDFSAPFAAALRLVVAVFVTLMAWLIYLAVALLLVKHGPTS